MAFKIRKGDGSSCEHCGAMDVPTAYVTDVHDHGSKVYLCYFCFHSSGRPYDTLTKGVAVQLMHALMTQLKPAKSRSKNA